MYDRAAHNNDLWIYDDNLLGYTHTDPTNEIEIWNRKAEEYFEKEAARQLKLASNQK